MPRIEVAGDLLLRRPKPTQGCRVNDDDNNDYDNNNNNNNIIIIIKQNAPHYQDGCLITSPMEDGQEEDLQRGGGRM
jgi:hypothetical protein